MKHGEFKQKGAKGTKGIRDRVYRFGFLAVLGNLTAMPRHGAGETRRI
jgi:hypothetical protein